MHLVEKRDGRLESWDSSKVERALELSTKESGESISPQILKSVVLWAEKQDRLTVADIHKKVEDSLMSYGYKDTARKYIEYRSMRDRERNKTSELAEKVKGLIFSSDEDIMLQNANKKSSLLPTHRDLLAGILSREFAKNLFSKEVIKEHEFGRIYIHDMDYALTPLHNCGVYDFESMLRNGFKLGNARIESPNSVGVATTVLSQIASTISSCSYGGQSIHKYNHLLYPYVLKSLEKLREEARQYNLPDEWVKKKLRKEIYDAHQTFIYQINTICGTNGQTAFCTISLYPSDNPIIRMITEEYLKCHMEGLGADHRTPTFPKVIYFVEDGVNLRENDPLYSELELAVECSTKRMYPDYVMVENNKKMSGFTTGPITPMGCRSFVPVVIENGKEKFTGRFNLGVVSINLAMAAAEAKGNYSQFLNNLDRCLEVAYKAHMQRIERLAKTKAGVNPIMWTQGALAYLQPDEEIGKLFSSYATVSIGYVGLSEALETLRINYSKVDSMAVLDWLKNRLESLSERSGLYFSLYGTPAESLCYSFANAVKREFPELNFQHDYLTNSFHRPVRDALSVIEKLDWESDFYLLSSGGNVNNIEIPNMMNNQKGLIDIIKYAYSKVNYLIVNQPVDVCYKCGYNGEFRCTNSGFSCPSCGNTDDESLSVIRRVSGYIAEPNSQPFNRGKQSEMIDRVKHCVIQK